MDALGGSDRAADAWEAVEQQLPSEGHGRGWEMVAPGASASDYDDFSIFPPSLHEGLHLRPDPRPSTNPSFSPQEQEKEQDQVAKEPPPGLTSHEVVMVMNLTRWRPLSGYTRRLIGSGLEVIHEKIALYRGGLGHLTGGKVWSLAAMAGFVGALMYIRRRMRRREQELLLLLIQEKDQALAPMLSLQTIRFICRIRELLNQIALLNHIVSARQQVSIRRHT